MIKVSVIIPVYNMGNYVRECLDSIFGQTLKEIEVVCINDGSTDNSLEILNEYRQKHENMVVFTQEKAGSGNARNAGIRLSRGEYVMFVDPDDYLAACDVLDTLYVSAKNNDVQICGGCIVRNRNGILEEGLNEVLRRGGVEKEGLFSFRECQEVANGHQRYIFKKELLIEKNIFYPRYLRGQDTLFIAEALNASQMFYLIKKNIYVYRVEYKTENYTEQKADDYINSLYDVLKLAIDNNLRCLYDFRLKTINNVAIEIWYKLLMKNGKWDRVIRVNQLIMKGNVVFGYLKNANCLMNKEEYISYVDKMKEEWKNLEKKIKSYDKIAIYGAGMVGKRACKCLRENGYTPDCFVVTDIKGNEKAVNNIPVVSIENFYCKKEYLFILCSADSTIRESMKKQLEDRGNENMIEFNYNIVSLPMEIDKEE